MSISIGAFLLKAIQGLSAFANVGTIAKHHFDSRSEENESVERNMIKFTRQARASIAEAKYSYEDIYILFKGIDKQYDGKFLSDEFCLSKLILLTNTEMLTYIDSKKTLDAEICKAVNQFNALLETVVRFKTDRANAFIEDSDRILTSIDNLFSKPKSFDETYEILNSLLDDIIRVMRSVSGNRQ